MPSYVLYSAFVISAVIVVLVTAAATVWVRVGKEIRTVYRTGGNLKKRIGFVRNKMKPHEGIPLVSIDASGGYKYVVLEHAGRAYVRASAEKEYHAHLVAAFFYEVGGGEMCCLGGGQINVDPETKTVRLFGTSEGYGADPDRKRTHALIEQSLGLKARG